jgi:hypothetical protein
MTDFPARCCPTFEKLGVLYNGRLVYGCTIRDEYAYAATDTPLENWEDVAWWSGNTEWVQDWLKQLRRQKREIGEGS